MKPAVRNFNRSIDCMTLHGVQTGELPLGNQSPVEIIILLHSTMIHHKDLYITDNRAGPQIRIRAAFRIRQKSPFKNDLLLRRSLLQKAVYVLIIPAFPDGFHLDGLGYIPHSGKAEGGRSYMDDEIAVQQQAVGYTHLFLSSALQRPSDTRFRESPVNRRFLTVYGISIFCSGSLLSLRFILEISLHQRMRSWWLKDIISSLLQCM